MKAANSENRFPALKLCLTSPCPDSLVCIETVTQSVLFPVYLEGNFPHGRMLIQSSAEHSMTKMVLGACLYAELLNTAE